MARHEMAFTVLTSHSTDDKVVLSTHRHYTDAAGVQWVETASGRVKKSDIEKATKPLRGRLNQYGEQITGDPEIDTELAEFVAEKRREKLAGNPAATEAEARIELPVEDAVDFKVRKWYLIRFEEMDAGVDLRSLITVANQEKVAVRREETRENEARS